MVSKDSLSHVDKNKTNLPFGLQLFLGAFCHKGKLIFLQSASKEDFFDTGTHNDHIQ
jgi:hypothetical protein